jgi:chromosome segregation ATPase
MRRAQFLMLDNQKLSNELKTLKKKGMNKNSNKNNNSDIYQNFDDEKDELFDNKKRANDIISKLQMEKNMLLNKIKTIEKLHKEEIQNILNLKNNDMKKFQNIFKKLQKSNFNNNLNYQEDEIKNLYIGKINELEIKIDFLSEQIYNLDKENKSLKNQNDNIRIKLKYQNQMINSLMSKNQYLENENNNIIENNDIERDSKFNVLLNDNEKLFQENLNLKNILNILNEKMRQIHIFLKKKKIAYENKIDEYKEKIVILKKRINELCTRNSCCYKNDYNKRKNKSLNFSKADNYLLTETSYNYNLDNNPNLGY